MSAAQPFQPGVGAQAVQAEQKAAQLPRAFGRGSSPQPLARRWIELCGDTLKDVRDILEAVARPPQRVKLRSLLTEIGREAGLTGERVLAGAATITGLTAR